MYYIAELSKPHIVKASKLIVDGKIIKEYPQQKLNKVAFNGLNKLRKFIKENNYSDRVINTYKKSVNGNKNPINL